MSRPRDAQLGGSRTTRRHDRPHAWVFDAVGRGPGASQSSRRFACEYSGGALERRVALAHSTVGYYGGRMTVVALQSPGLASVRFGRLQQVAVRGEFDGPITTRNIPFDGDLYRRIEAALMVGERSVIEGGREQQGSDVVR